ncbi:MAG: VanZ family protein [Lachnobacterium sp.]|nr:VanZ family protein [Lachnobacterium sp.]
MAVSNMKGKKERIISIIIFVIYIIALCYFLFFAESMGRTTRGDEYHYNLQPLFEIKRIWRSSHILGMKYVILNFAGNVIAFIPFGYLLPKMVKKKPRLFHTVLFSFEFSLLVELTQLISRTGSFDVDDLILNTFGGLIGYILYYGRVVSGKK